MVGSVAEWPVPYNQTGAFAFLAWQLLWVAGLRAGALHVRRPRQAKPQDQGRDRCCGPLQRGNRVLRVAPHHRAGSVRLPRLAERAVRQVAPRADAAREFRRSGDTRRARATAARGNRRAFVDRDDGTRVADGIRRAPRAVPRLAGHRRSDALDRSTSACSTARCSRERWLRST